MLIDADLHIHSHYSKAVSKAMTVPNLAQNARFKGLGMVGTGDILNPKWEEEVVNYTKKAADGTYERAGVRFLLTTEVEDSRRVHHVLIFPDLARVHEMREVLRPYSADIETEGRPHLALSAAEVADIANDLGVLIGPAHAFTPWTSLYKEYSSLREAYQGAKVHFLELGLSADSEMADRIKAHHGLTYLSNSDAHSPMPHRLGREFNRFKIKDATFEEVRKAILGRGGRKVVLNAGLDPRLGKYHMTACSRCYTRYSLGEAKAFHWKCPKCGGRIKKGVMDRILELADTQGRPKDRPPYVHLTPLAEVISMVLGRGVETKAVRAVWERFLREFESEIRVLLDVPVEGLAKVHEDVAKAVWAYRTRRLIVIPGGGGKYGEIRLPEEIRNARVEELESVEVETEDGDNERPKQLSITEFLRGA